MRTSINLKNKFFPPVFFRYSIIIKTASFLNQIRFYLLSKIFFHQTFFSLKWIRLLKNLYPINVLAFLIIGYFFKIEKIFFKRSDLYSNIYFTHIILSHILDLYLLLIELRFYLEWFPFFNPIHYPITEFLIIVTNPYVIFFNNLIPRARGSASVLITIICFQAVEPLVKFLKKFYAPADLTLEVLFTGIRYSQYFEFTKTTGIDEILICN